MRLRGVLPFAIPLAFLMLMGALPGMNGWTGLGLARPEAGTNPPAAADPRQPPSDATRSGAAEAIRKAQTEYEKAILAVDDAFVIAYNRGDSKALAALFAEDAEAVEADGERYQGRGPIERRFAETFAASPGVQISLAIDAIRLLNPDVAKEEGRTIIKPPKGLPLNRPLHGPLRQARRPLADLLDPRGAGPVRQRARPPQGAGMDDRRRGSTKGPIRWSGSIADGRKTRTSCSGRSP